MNYGSERSLEDVEHRDRPNAESADRSAENCRDEAMCSDMIQKLAK